jgi:hypothetical protein
MTRKRSREVHFGCQRSRSQNRSLVRGVFLVGGEDGSMLPFLFWRVSIVRQPISHPTSRLVPIRSLLYALACTAKCASGTAGGFVRRQPVTQRHCQRDRAATRQRGMELLGQSCSRSLRELCPFWWVRVLVWDELVLMPYEKGPKRTTKAAVRKGLLIGEISLSPTESLVSWHHPISLKPLFISWLLSST